MMPQSDEQALRMQATQATGWLHHGTRHMQSMLVGALTGVVTVQRIYLVSGGSQLLQSQH